MLDDLLFHLRSSTDVLTRQSRSVLGRTTRRVPLILKQDFSLVPVKGRERLSEYDAVTGYIVLSHTEKIIDLDDAVQVVFTGGAKVQVYDNIRTLADKIRTTERMLDEMDETS